MKKLARFYVAYQWHNLDESIRRIEEAFTFEHPFVWIKKMRENYPNSGYGSIVFYKFLSKSEKLIVSREEGM